MKSDCPTKPSTIDAHQDTARKNRSYPFSMHDLCAYIDGELPMAKRRAFEQQLAADAGIRLRLAALVQVQALVRLAYGAKKAED